MVEEPYREFYCAILEQAFTDLKIKTRDQGEYFKWIVQYVTLS